MLKLFCARIALSSLAVRQRRPKTSSPSLSGGGKFGFIAYVILLYFYVIHRKYLGDILYLVLYVYVFSLLLIYVSLQKLMRVEQPLMGFWSYVPGSGKMAY